MTKTPPLFAAVRHTLAGVLILGLLAGASLSFVAPAVAVAAEPMLMPGKTDLYRRILTRPAAAVVDAPGGAVRSRPSTFSAYYVFAEKAADGKKWLQVGPGRRAAPVGWIEAGQTVEWKTTMVLSFNNSTGRLPVLFFKDKPSLRRLVEDERLSVLAPDYAERARRGSPPPDAGIISIEPATTVDLRERFYLLPVLEAETTYLATGTNASLVRIASIPLREPPTGPAAAGDFRTGIMFVIDTTISMQPYIDRTRQALQRIHETILRSPVGNKVSFGLIEFRDNTGPAPGLEYITRVGAPLRTPPDHDDFLQRMSAVRVARVPSAGFNEDGLAGVLAALGSDDWKHFGGRYIIFLSDAGVREPPDPLSTTGMTASEINSLARDKNVAIFSLLMATSAGVAHHARAETQMRTLSHWNDCTPPPFYAVPQGAINDFGPIIDALTQALVRQIEAAAAATASHPTGGATAGVSCGGGTGSARDGLLAAAADIGQAMQMAWLGRARGTEAPDVFEAWAPDFALNDPNRKAFEVRLLLTKKQLSRMASALQLVLEAGQTVLDGAPERFFDQLRTVVARAARDPSRLEDMTAAMRDPSSLDNLGDLLGEYLDDLPYRSQLTEISADMWMDASPSHQDQLLTSVKSKLRAYQSIHDDAGRWVKLTDGAPEDEWVSPIPLSFLP